MKTRLRSVWVLGALLALLAGAGCQPTPPQPGNPPATNAPAPAAPPAPTPTAPVSDRSADMPITLPVLDALFHEEGFENDLKAKLQLTDEQVEKLKTIARENTAGLREETGGAEYSGSTAEATRRADEQIRAAIGPEKAQQLYAFVQERSSGGGAGEAPSTPGSVPTDTRIVVNIPAYRMDVFENGKLLKTYRVGIGYPEFPLPTGLRKADTIIVNPSWTTPDEPWVEAAHKLKPGDKIPPGDKRNPLGPIKIPIGLPNLIHGGKSPAKLGGFASHGCVGLTTPQVEEFAVMLARLAGADLTPEQLKTYEANKTETKTIKLPKAIPVELRYETIVVEDGNLHVDRDVYDKNTNTEENLRAVLQAYGVTPEQLSAEERAQVTDALKEMSRNAQGKLEDAPKSDPKSAKVTTTVKGKKEIVIPIAALQGKGYPASVDLNDGGAPKAKKK